MKTMRLSDSSIHQVVRLIQLGILTGTDVSDQLRTFELQENDLGKLDPSPDFLSQFEENLSRLQENVKDGTE